MANRILLDSLLLCDGRSLSINFVN